MTRGGSSLRVRFYPRLQPPIGSPTRAPRRERRSRTAAILALVAALVVALTSVARAEERGLLLVAKPSLPDPNFAGTVVLVAQADSGASLGVVLNRPADRSLAQAMADDPRFARFTEPLFLGGPVERNGLFAVFRATASPGPALRIADDLWLALMPETVERLLLDPPEQLRLYVGYAGWAPGQLAYEIERGGWWVMEPEVDVAFRSDTRRLWDELSARASAVRTRLQEPPRLHMPTSVGIGESFTLRGASSLEHPDPRETHAAAFSLKRRSSPSRAATEAGVAPRRALERQMVVLRGIRDAEMEAHDIEERRRRQSHALVAIPGGDVESRLVHPGHERLLQRRAFEQALARYQCVGDALRAAQQLDTHSGRDDASRDIDHVNRDAGHGVSSASHRTP